jgi:hypothetical protein
VASSIEKSQNKKLRGDKEFFLVSDPPFAMFCWNMSLTEAAGVCVLAANRGEWLALKRATSREEILFPPLPLSYALFSTRLQEDL